MALGVEVEPQQLGAAVGVQVDRGRPGREAVGAFGGIAELLGLWVPHPHPAAPGRSHQRRQALPDPVGRAALRGWRTRRRYGSRSHELPGEKRCGAGGVEIGGGVGGVTCAGLLRLTRVSFILEPAFVALWALWLAPKRRVSVCGCGGPLNGRWRFCSGIGSPRLGGDFWYLGPGASYAVCARKTDREVVDVPPGARVGVESGIRWRNIRSDTLVTCHECGDGRGLVQGGHSVTHHEGDAASLARMQAA